MHQFIAKENSCFFDICLPNYSPDGAKRKVTYYKETDALFQNNLLGGRTEIEYYTTPEIRMPDNFEVNEISYRGELA